MYGSLIGMQDIKSTNNLNHYYYNNSGDFFMHVKLFDESHELDLERSINKWLVKNKVDVVSIKYSISTSVCGEDQIYCFSALILYK